MKNLPLFAFFAVALLELFGEATANQSLIFATKPTLMPLLAVWFAISTNRHGERSFFRRAILSALVFSTLGDVLMMFPDALYFILGLGCFLLAQLFYGGAFFPISNFKNGFLRRNPTWAILFLAFPCLLLAFLWGGIPVGMKFPVALYACAVTGMALSVLSLKGEISDSVFWPMMAGAVLFLSSDSLIAIARFGQPFEGARLAIMLIYLAAQFLLVQGAVKIGKG